MKKAEKINIIIELFKRDKTLKTAKIITHFNNTIDRTTIYRYLKELIELWKIKELSKWLYQYKIDPLTYCNRPFFERETKKYNFDFLLKYIPNETSFLTDKQKDILLEKSSNLEINTNYYKENRRSLENLLIDLSYASSKLEWNTYSYLDTEVLVNFNEIAEGKQKDETQMILNHKDAIEYMIYYKKKLNFEAKSFFEIHSLLWKWLLPKLELWKIREKTVEIWRCKYIPIDNKYQLQEQFELFLKKLNQINNPFEQSLFILIFIPYFQIFLDINKRTSRMICNLPLLKNNLWVISLLQVKERDYIVAILSIYELNDITLMRDLFVNNYLLNFNRYI